MSLDIYFPFLYNYWSQLLTLVVCYFGVQYIMRLKNHPPEMVKTENRVLTKNKKFLTPDQGFLEVLLKKSCLMCSILTFLFNLYSI